MRFYGTIETNLGSLYKEYGIGSDHFSYSVDSLQLESDTDEIFDIDFEEGDFAISDASISFRLKSMSNTFSYTWDKLDIESLENIENDYEFFNKCKLNIIVLYIPDHDKVDNVLLSKMRFRVTHAYIQIQNKDIIFDTIDIVTEVYNG